MYKPTYQGDYLSVYVPNDINGSPSGTWGAYSITALVRGTYKIFFNGTVEEKTVEANTQIFYNVTSSGQPINVVAALYMG